MSVDIAVVGNQIKSTIIRTSVNFVMKYFKHYTEWAVSQPVLSRLGKLFKNEMSQKSGKSPRGAESPQFKMQTILRWGGEWGRRHITIRERVG